MSSAEVITGLYPLDRRLSVDQSRLVNFLFHRLDYGADERFVTPNDLHVLNPAVLSDSNGQVNRS